MPNKTDPFVYLALANNVPAVIEAAFREGCAAAGVTRAETQDARWAESGAREYSQGAGVASARYGGGRGKRGAR